MVIGVIGAMDIEVDFLKESLSDIETRTISDITFCVGSFKERKDVKIVVAKSGIGKVNAAMCTQTMILQFNVEKIINIGVGGALSGDLHVYDVVVADKLCQHDMDTSPIGDPVGLISGINMIYIPTDEEMTKKIETSLQKIAGGYKKGTIATGDIFVDTKEQRERIATTFDAISADMESCSIAQVCYINKIPVAVIRAISDADGAVDYMSFAQKAARISIDVVSDYIKNF